MIRGVSMNALRCIEFVCLFMVLTISVLNTSCIGVSIPKPAIPYFTVNFIDSSYSTKTAYSTDPYTGKQITNPSIYVESRTIEVRIENTAFTPFAVQEGSTSWTANLMYNIRWKGHFEKDWHELYNPSDGYLPRGLVSEAVYSVKGEYSKTEGLNLSIISGWPSTLPIGSQIDFQVEAMIGYTHRVIEGTFAPWYFFGEKSGWSNTQTLTITETALTSSPNPTSSPTPLNTTPSQTTEEGPQTDVVDLLQIAVIVLSLVVVVLAAALVYSHRKNNKPDSYMHKRAIRVLSYYPYLSVESTFFAF